MSLQIQSVIYGNKKESLLKAIKAIKQSVKVYKMDDGTFSVSLIYGDASPEPIFSDDEVRQIKQLADGFFEFEYRFFGFNSGTAKGHNLLGLKCTTEYMMIMNPDVILEPTCLINLMQVFTADQVGMAEARQTPLEHAKEYNLISGETEWASTACTIFKTAIFHELQGFDEETFFLYCDDLDFSWRLRLAGYKIQYVPKAIAYHSKELAMNGDWKPTNAEVYYSAEAAMLLAYKWSNPERAEYLFKMYTTHGGESERKAAIEFEKRKEKNKLPEMIDAQHKIARFIGDDYCDMRFHFHN